MTGLTAGIDAGGTTFKCGLQSPDGSWLAMHRVGVTSPDDTIAGCLDFFSTASAGTEISALGIASFGPIDVDPASPRYGTLMSTPKPGWAGIALRQRFADALGVAVHLDTDVNGALLAEMDSGAARGARSAAYITIGTGIGAGLSIDGRLVGKPFHPEFGHIPVPRHADDHDFKGACPFHADCLEGLSSVTALKQRWGDPVDWSVDHPGWDVAAYYIGAACATLLLTMRLERIVLGGGLMLADGLLARIHTATSERLADYIDEDVSERIVRPGHGDDAGLMGAICLAKHGRVA